MATLVQARSHYGVMETPQTRRAIRCTRCQLVQFETASGLCRRCHMPQDKGHVDEELRWEDQRSHVPVLSHDAIAVRVGSRVRMIRTEQHLSQRELGARLNCPRTYLSKIEGGKIVPTLLNLRRLAEVLHTDVYLLVCDGPMFETVRQWQAIEKDPFLTELAEMLPMLTSTHLAIIRTWLRDRIAANRPANAVALRSSFVSSQAKTRSRDLRSKFSLQY